MPAPAFASGAPAPLKAYTVRITWPDGVNLDYQAIADSSAGALLAALETHGIARIMVSPTPRRKK